MNSVRLVCDGGAGKVEGKGREMSQRAHARSGRSAAVRTVECRMIVYRWSCLCTDFSQTNNTTRKNTSVLLRNWAVLIPLNLS